MRNIVQRVMARVDEWYERKYRLRALGPVLRIGYVRYRGPRREFADGTVLNDNELIGRLHFNNSSIVGIGDGSLHRTGFRFAKLMRQSLLTLAEASVRDPELRAIRVGFESTPRPKTWRTRVLSSYFKLLMWTFAPAARTRARALPEPRDYWLTQRMLAQNAHKLSKVQS